MSDLTIRPATADDLDVIVDFNARIASETEDTVLDRNTLRAGVQVLLEDPAKGRYFVACVDGVVVGQVMHTREWSDWRNGDIWWIQSVYVHADHRRRGVFAGLYRHLQELAETAPGVVGLRLYVEVDNTPAQATYARLGMDDASYLVMQEIFG
jgi:ribosomal protein S18 acetylase RimI-like enzyme